MIPLVMFYYEHFLIYCTWDKVIWDERTFIRVIMILPGEEKEVNESILLQEDIWGVHNSTTSLTFLEKFALTESVPKGQPMKMKVDLLNKWMQKSYGLK